MKAMPCAVDIDKRQRGNLVEMKEHQKEKGVIARKLNRVESVVHPMKDNDREIRQMKIIEQVVLKGIKEAALEKE